MRAAASSLKEAGSRAMAGSGKGINAIDLCNERIENKKIMKIERIDGSVCGPPPMLDAGVCIVL